MFVCRCVCKHGFLEIRSAGHKTGDSETQKHMVPIGHGLLLFLLCNYHHTSQTNKAMFNSNQTHFTLMATFSLKMCLSWARYFRFWKVKASNMPWVCHWFGVNMTVWENTRIARQGACKLLLCIIQNWTEFQLRDAEFQFKFERKGSRFVI